MEACEASNISQKAREEGRPLTMIYDRILNACHLGLNSIYIKEDLVINYQAILIKDGYILKNPINIMGSIQVLVSWEI